MRFRKFQGKGLKCNSIASTIVQVPTWRSGDETARRVEVVEGPEFEPGRKPFFFLFFLLFSFSFSFFLVIVVSFCFFTLR